MNSKYITLGFLLKRNKTPNTQIVPWQNKGQIHFKRAPWSSVCSCLPTAWGTHTVTVHKMGRIHTTYLPTTKVKNFEELGFFPQLNQSVQSAFYPNCKMLCFVLETGLLRAKESKSASSAAGWLLWGYFQLSIVIYHAFFSAQKQNKPRTEVKMPSFYFDSQIYRSFWKTLYYRTETYYTTENIWKCLNSILSKYGYILNSNATTHFANQVLRYSDGLRSSSLLIYAN